MFKLLQPVDVVTGPTQLLLTITLNNSCMQYVYTRETCYAQLQKVFILNTAD